MAFVYACTFCFYGGSLRVPICVTLVSCVLWEMRSLGTIPHAACPEPDIQLILHDLDMFIR